MATIHFLGSFIFFYLNFPSTYSILQSEALLKLKDSFANATILDSWKPGTEPCTKGREWDHVVCANAVASGLRLGNLGLSGDIDVDALVSLPGLRSISFVSNRFSGPIPDFHQMSNLRGLFLSGNQFSGEIPSDYFTKLVALKKVWLSGNQFSGQVPLSLSNLSGLIELHLEDNKFSGKIPPLVQPSLVSLNISNNMLEGEIPFHVMSKFGLDSFNGNPGLCGGSLDNACNLSSDTGNGNSPELRYLWVLIPVGILFLAMISSIFVLKRRQDRAMTRDELPRARSSTAGNTSPERGGSGYREGSRECDDIMMMDEGVGVFVMSDLITAAAEVIGNGTLGRSYKATMDNGLTVVVKTIKEMNNMGRDEFDGEMRKLASLKHQNLLAPMAYRYQCNDKLLIYEHQPEGSLHFALHGDQGISQAQLNWPARLKIIQGIATGLHYLHCELSSLDLPHGNLKSTNVLLTPEHEALLVDYALSSLITDKSGKTALAAYDSPEAILHNQISQKCDVFCLGVIILEILTGKCPNLSKDEDGVETVEWARSAIAEERHTDILDPQIVSDKIHVGEMEVILQLSVACMESNPEQRLDMMEAVKMIESIPVEGSLRT